MTEERMAATALDVAVIVVLDAHPKLHEQHYPQLSGRHVRLRVIAWAQHAFSHVFEPIVGTPGVSCAQVW